MKSGIRPQETVTESELQFGLRMLMLDAVCTQTMGTFAGGAFLVAFALLLGASNLIVGIVAAMGPLTQLLQVPAIYLVERIGNRKLLCVVNSFFSRLFWFLAAGVPWLIPAPYRVDLFLFALAMYYGLGTLSGLSFSSWMRDLIPDAIRGRYSARRMAVATAVGAASSLAAGYGVDIYKTHAAEIGIYSIYFALAGCAGWLGINFLYRIPEPQMQPRPPANLLTLISEPFRDRNFRRVLNFLGSWNFAINLAAPFFTVYMLKRLELSMTIIIALSVLSQIVNILFVRLWGMLADRFSNKSVLLEAGPLFILNMIIWPFTTMPESYVLTLPLLIIIHALAGMSTAGVALCTGNIALKLAPKGKATAYLAVNALVSGLAATIAPLLGGLMGTWLDGERLRVMVRWLSMADIRFKFPLMDLEGLDFLFILSFLLGIFSIKQLLAIKEQGEAEEGVVLAQFRLEVRKALRTVSNVAGMRDLFYFPFARLRDLMHNNNEKGENRRSDPDLPGDKDNVDKQG